MTDGISGRDLDALRDLLALNVDDPGPGLPWGLMECMRALFHSDSMKLCRSKPALEEFVLEQALGETRFVEIGAEDPHYWELEKVSPACNYPQRTGDIFNVTKLSDFVSD